MGASSPLVRWLDGGHSVLTFAGCETFLIYQQDRPLRDFCAFEILDDEEAWTRFVAGFVHPILDAAAEGGHGVLTDAFVWRASPDWMARLGYGPGDLRRFQRLAVRRLREAIATWRKEQRVQAGDCPVFLAAEVGPRGDGYAVAPGGAPTPAQARDYHARQVAALAEAGAELLVALTMTSASEAQGIVRAAEAVGLPVIVSPTVETDGRLPDGSSLRSLVETIDDATGGGPELYLVNCAHPLHLGPTLDRAADRGEAWLDRLQGLRANASALSHEELDRSTSLDRGDVDDLARRVAALAADHDLRVVGGCCGTDSEHVRAMGRALGG